MKIYPLRIILLFCAGLCVQQPAFPEQKVNLDDKLISATFKSLAKTFVAVTDIDKLKKNNIKKLNKMSDVKFKKQQAKAYPVLKELPLALKDEYGVQEEMSKAQVIKNIESLDKKKMYAIIDSVPDAVISRLFKQELNKAKLEMFKSDPLGQIKKFWEKTIQKSGGK